MRAHEASNTSHISNEAIASSSHCYYLCYTTIFGGVPSFLSTLCVVISSRRKKCLSTLRKLVNSTRKRKMGCAVKYYVLPRELIASKPTQVSKIVEPIPKISKIWHRTKIFSAKHAKIRGWHKWNLGNLSQKSFWQNRILGEGPEKWFSCNFIFGIRPKLRFSLILFLGWAEMDRIWPGLGQNRPHLAWRLR